MNHYVVTRTIHYRIKAESWKAAREAALDLHSESAASDVWEMVEEETGREEVLSG